MGQFISAKALKRYPHRQNETLQAWDSADDLLLDHLATLDLVGKKILIINDQFGALTYGLKDQQITVYTDSYVSSQAIKLNCGEGVQMIHRLEEIQDHFDLAILKLPNNTSFFEDILSHLGQKLRPGTSVICAGMVKYMAASYFTLLQKWVGETTTSLAQKKARLIFSKIEKPAMRSPYPLSVQIEGFEKPFFHHSNLFSREKLDIGTRFFLEHIPTGCDGRILDLGCANGVVGIRAKQLNPSSRIIFSDDSQMAVDSARLNYVNQTGLDQNTADFIWTHAFENQPRQSIDIVLCNPPFHQQNVVGDSVAWQMFVDARAALKKNGLLRIIGNSHLGYQLKLKKIFGNAKQIAANKKFVIIDSVLLSS